MFNNLSPNLFLQYIRNKVLILQIGLQIGRKGERSKAVLRKLPVDHWQKHWFTKVVLNNSLNEQSTGGEGECWHVFFFPNNSHGIGHSSWHN